MSMGMEMALEELVDSRLWADHHNRCPSRDGNGERAEERKPDR